MRRIVTHALAAAIGIGVGLVLQPAQPRTRPIEESPPGVRIVAEPLPIEGVQPVNPVYRFSDLGHEYLVTIRPGEVVILRTH